MANRTRILLSAASKLKKCNKGIPAAAATSSVNATEELAVCESDPPPSSYIPLHHHRDRSLFRPITPGTFRYITYHYFSSLKGLTSLLTSQEARDRFVTLTGGNENADNDDQDNLYSNRIVNANVLGQSDMGFLKPMTLFHELNSPLYNQYGIEDKVDIKDFLDGCGFAIEQYMRAINDNLRGGNFRKWANKVLGDAREMSKTESDTSDDIEKLMAVMSTPPDSVEKYDFTEVGRKDPNSIEAFLMDMTTPIGWDNHNFNARMKLRLEISEDNLPKFATAQDLASHHSGEKLNAKVLHVALLSARLEEIEAPLAVNNNNTTKGEETSDPDAPLEDDSLIPHSNNSDQESSTQVVAQFEVLYDLELTLENDDGETQTETEVNVACFEACLYGDPNGDELRWRLHGIRPAFEFATTP
mmetsp:Transcript_10812/g.21031  ORF Transcript_10812/g.21031 Transcript_10812/m.21031 type:complete len:415 (+) Transcript_10812:131-1375(+)